VSTPLSYRSDLLPFNDPWVGLSCTEAHQSGWASVLDADVVPPTIRYSVSTLRTRTDGEPALAVWDYVVSKPPGVDFKNPAPAYNEPFEPRQNINKYWMLEHKKTVAYNLPTDDRSITGYKSRYISTVAHTLTHKKLDKQPITLSNQKGLCTYTQEYINMIAKVMISKCYNIPLDLKTFELDRNIGAYGVVGEGWATESRLASIRASEMFDKYVDIYLVSVVPGVRNCSLKTREDVLATSNMYQPVKITIMGYQTVEYITAGQIYLPTTVGYATAKSVRGDYAYRLHPCELEPPSPVNNLAVDSHKLGVTPPLPCYKCLIFDDTIEGELPWPRGKPKDFKSDVNWASRWRSLVIEMFKIRKASSILERRTSTTKYRNWAKAVNNMKEVKIRNAEGKLETIFK
jgi:hypothetical protein